jgi:SNF2 family DNA or RNA helicase
MINSKWLLEIAGWKTFDEGKRLFAQGAAGQVKFESSFLTGVVLDKGKKWKPRLKIGSNSTEVLNLCDCPPSRQTGLICPHVVAAALHFEKMEGFRKETSPTEKKNEVEVPLSAANPWIAAKVTDETPDWRLEIHLLHPVEKQFSLNPFPIELRAEASSSKSVPLHLLQPQSLPYQISQEDRDWLDWLANYRDLQNKSRALIPHSHLMPFLLRCAEKKPLQFKSLSFQLGLSPHRHQITGKFTPAGDLSLTFKTYSPFPILAHCQDGYWYQEKEQILFQASLVEPYRAYANSFCQISRDQIGPFLFHDLPRMESYTDVQISTDTLNLIPPAPQLLIQIEGGFRGLQLQAQIQYGTVTKSITENTLYPKRGDDWIPHPGKPFDYYQRDLEFEKKWTKEILRLGFKPVSTDPTQFSTIDPKAVEKVLSHHLGEWKKEHQVKVGERLGKLLETTELISPEITIFPNQNGWLSVEIQFQDSTGKNRLDPAQVQQLLQKNESQLTLRNGRRALVPTDLIQQFQETIRDCQVESHPQGFRIRNEYASSLHHALEKNQWKVSGRSVWSPPPSIQELQPITLTSPFAPLLRPYQSQGVQWLHYLKCNRFGGILADEMGLGKTIQTLAFIDYHLEQRKSSTTATSLVVAPTSLLWNWKAEAERFAPHLQVIVIEGDDREKLLGKISQYHLVITSYALLRRDIDSYSGIEFDLLFLDEAQHIKNRQSQNALSAKGLRAKHRFVLTGTPMENSVADLWSIFDFLMPGYLGPAREFKERYETPILKHDDFSALERLRHRITPFVLRRTKKEVAKDLPEKIEQLVYCDLTPEQTSVYHAILEESRKQVDQAISKNGEEKSRFALFSALTRLRQTCCHLGLLPKLEDKTWKSPSSKFLALEEILEESMDGGHRVLIFSQFVKLLGLLRNRLDQDQIRYCYLDGESDDRQEQVEKFQSDPHIPLFLISLKAGGTGLNLTAADTVIFLDPWWNPAVEAQAIGRAHRIGQKQVVTSLKLVTRNTVEEKIVQLQNRKKEWIDQTFTDENAVLQSLNLQELRSLLE